MSLIQSLAQSGRFADLKWPTFSDVAPAVSQFYSAGKWTPVWTSGGQPTPQAAEMIDLFRGAEFKGLRREDYDASRWAGAIAKLKPATATPLDDDVARFDLAMTVCAMRYFSALHNGRINPNHFKFALTSGPAPLDLAGFIRGKIINGADLPSAAASVEPHFAGYLRAEDALPQYLKLAQAGDGAPVPMPAVSVRPSDNYAGLPQLDARLRLLGDLPANAPPPAGAVYQGALVTAVKHFQDRHGLATDGVLGKGTVAAINVPLHQRVVELDLTLERYRWIPPTFPQPPIVVNIPEFRLRTLRRQPGGFISMAVVVGRAMRTQTPVFADYMKYLVFRPYWLVPMSIQFNELVPKTRRDPGYLAAHGYQVVDGSGNVITDGVVSDDVLSGLRSGAYQIRQKPGPKNALGLVKFIFPNRYNVYLHSTPSPELFSRARRDFSHGCIRVAEPAKLAAWVLRDDPNWTPAKIDAAMNGSQTIQVNLKNPIPVLILYSTAVVTPEGSVHFYDDIYGYDKPLLAAIDSGPPYPS